MKLWVHPLMPYNKILHLSLDDIDTQDYGCTTYTLSLIVKELISIGVPFVDYPHLVRLNPNIPWKTRGNGAVSIIVKYENKDKIFNIANQIVYESYAKATKKSTPALILCEKENITDDMIHFSEEALYKVLSIKQAKSLIKKHDLLYTTYGGELGLIGALAALANPLIEHTYELICYRLQKNFGFPRKVDKESVIKMSEKTFPYTFNNYDPLSKRILITPHSNDPILFGIRGLSPNKLIEAFNMIKIEEEISHFLIFKTNQGTNSHLNFYFKISEIKPYYSVKIRGYVKTNPIVARGGHVFFILDDGSAEINCAAYEPTKTFRNIINKLLIGDYIEVGGGVRPPNKKHPLMVLNIEYVNILKLAEEYVYENPICPKCKNRTKSLGRNKGFKCEKCKSRFPNFSKEKRIKPRTITPGIYIPPPSAHRHLTKPLQYYGLDLKINAPFDESIFYKQFT
ncbi:MAG: tRNA(Ile)(2)-agmatinylcytidine synthase [Nitrososphaeria archaeon]